MEHEKTESRYEPLVLFPYVVPLAQIDEVGHRLGGEQRQAIDDLDLSKPPKERVSTPSVKGRKTGMGEWE